MIFPSQAKILISGATGNVGSKLASLLSLKGIPYRAMVRKESKDLKRIQGLAGAELVNGDFDDPATLESALSGIEKAFLVTNSSEKAETQQKTFVDAAKKTGVRHIVKLSQWAADIHSPVRYLRYHAAVEQHIIESGLFYTFLRPNLFMQGFLGFAESIRTNHTLFAPIGNAKVSVIDVRDIAAVGMAALTNPGHENKTYSLTGPEALTHAEIARKLSAAVGDDISFVEISSNQMLQILKQIKFPAWQAEGLIEDYSHYNRGEAAEVTHVIRNTTGNDPITFDQFARDFQEMFRP